MGNEDRLAGLLATEHPRPSADALAHFGFCVQARAGDLSTLHRTDLAPSLGPRPKLDTRSLADLPVRESPA